MLTASNPEYQRRIPAAFREWRRFLLARICDKAPCDIHGRVCDAHNSSNWVTSTELESSPLIHDPAYGIAFIIVEGDGVVCIDLDKCVGSDGMITGVAAAIVARFPGAYVETSVSGTGRHVFFRATLPAHRTRFQGGEIYSRRRYILLTGRDASGDAAVDHSVAAGQFIRDFGLEGSGELSELPTRLPSAPAPGSTGQFIADADLIRIMHSEAGTPGVPTPGAGRSKFGSGAHFTDLWTRNESVLCVAYPEQSPRGFDWSSADAALMMKLSFYTGGDIERMFRLFKQSALFRPALSDEDIWRKTGVSIGVAISGARFYDRPVIAGAAVPALPGAPAVSSVPPPPAVVLPPVVDLSQAVQADIPEIEWTVKDWFPHEAISYFGGDGGKGKTTLLIQLMLAASGMNLWLGKLVTPRRVLFVSGEDSVKRITRSVKHIAGKMKCDATNCYVLSLDGFADPFLVKFDRDNKMIITSAFEYVCEHIRALNLSMVIFDPVANLFGGNENDRIQVTQFLSLLRNRIAEGLHCTVILNAHPSREGIREGSGFSGSGAWNNSVKSRLYLDDHSDKQRIDARILKLMKANDARAGQQIAMQWQDGMFFADDNDTISNTDENIDRIFMEILNRRMRLGLSVSYKPSSTYAPVVFEGDENACGIKRRQFERSMIRLKEGGMIDFIEDGPPSKRRFYVVPTALPTASN